MSTSASAFQIPSSHPNVTPSNTGFVKQDGLKVTPALRAARTRAWKTLEQFSQAETEELFPSNSFVAFKISSQKLKEAGIPTVRTKWEDRVRGPSASLGRISSMSKNGYSDAERDSTQKLAHEEASNVAFKVSDVKNVVDVRRNTNTACEEIAENARTLNGQSSGLWNSSHTNSVPITSAEVTLCVTSQLSNTSSQISNHIPSVSTLQSVLETTPQLNHTDIGAIAADFVTDNSTESRPIVEKNYLTKSRVFQAPKEADIRTSGDYTSTESYSTSVSKRKGEDEVLIKNSGENLDREQNDGLIKRPKLDLKPSSLAESSFQPISPSKGLEAAAVASAKHFQVASVNFRDKIRQAPSIEKSFENPSHPNHPYLKDQMAPVRDPNSVDSSLKDAIQKLYDVQLQVHGFVPETQPLLIDKMAELAHSLAHLQTLTSPISSPNNPIHKNRIAPEVIDYVDDSRNPDIYNREFVELVQRGNAVMNGKQQAFKDFSEVFADALKNGMPDLSDQVDRVMDSIKASGKMSSSGQISSGVANGAVKTERKNDGPGKADFGANGASKA